MSKLKHYLEIDIIKGIAILCVIISHSMPYTDTINTIRMLTISQAVPIFFLVMGRNNGASFQIRNYYSLNHVIYPTVKTKNKKNSISFYSGLLGIVNTWNNPKQTHIPWYFNINRIFTSYRIWKLFYINIISICNYFSAIISMLY